MAPPKTWYEAFEVAKVSRGFVSAALWPVDAMICFITLCANYGEPAFSSSDRVIGDNVGQCALERLRQLSQCSLPEASTMNPIAIWERMSSSDDVAYCPLAFGYSNYSRVGYRHSLISFGETSSRGASGPVGATLGAAGIAVSRNCQYPEVAVEYALWVAGPDCQRTLYVDSGGQLGNRAAWLDDHANRITNGYFAAHFPHSRAHGCAPGPWDLCSFKRLRPRSLDVICLTEHLSARPWNRSMVYGPRCTKRKTSMTREQDLCVAI
jgi:multiple sugar transport system substrate-binding protein